MKHSRDFIQQSVNMRMYDIARNVHTYVDNLIFSDAGMTMLDTSLLPEEELAKLMLSIILGELSRFYSPGTPASVEIWNKLMLTSGIRISSDLDKRS